MDCAHSTTTTNLKFNKLNTSKDNSNGLQGKSSSLVQGWG